MKVSEAMTAQVRCCSPDTSLDDVARMMWAEDCGAIPVVDGENHPVGIVTDRDIAMCAMLSHKPLYELSCSKIIDGQHVVSCSENDEIETCVAKMEENRVRRIIVTDDEGKVCGIVSMGDAVQFAKEQPDPIEGCAIETDEVMGMLRKVSGKNGSGDQAQARQQVH